jgi:hypothetical protein
MGISKEWMKKDYLKKGNFIPTGRRESGRPKKKMERSVL